MRISVKTFACAVAVSIAFLACNDLGTNSDSNSDSNSDKAPVSCKIYISDDVYDGPSDPAIVTIVGDVKDWMDEQLASGNKERKLIWIAISDLPLIKNPIEEPAVSGTYNSATGDSKWFVNGREVTYDELKEITEAWRLEVIKLKEELISSYMSSVHIPGEEVEMLHGGWKALMTAEDIVELAENNEGLAISFYIEPVPDGGLGGSSTVLTMSEQEVKYLYLSRCP